MVAPFAALEDRVNNAVLSRLSNMVATVNGTSLDVIFDNGFALGSVGPFGMASTTPQITLQTNVVPPAVVGMPVVVNGVNYTVAAHEPDGTGISRLLLEAA